MRVLYLPIFEPGAFHDVAVRNKRGLHDALVQYGCTVREIDYLSITTGLEDALAAQIADFEPDLMLTQLHGHEPVTVGMMQRLRQIRPSMQVVNWSGDSWRHSLVGERYLPLVRQFDLQLVAVPEIVPEYTRLGIPAAFWQIAYERPVGKLPDVPAYDVVFLGNLYTEQRRQMVKMLRELTDVHVGIYGDGEGSDGVNKYDFGAGEALYKRAKVAIADWTRPDGFCTVSDRPIQILMAGGATLLHQQVPKMDVLLGIRAGRHYIEWHTLEDLRFKILYWIRQYSSGPQQRIVEAGQRYAHQHHRYEARVRQLFEELLPMIEGVKA